MFVVALTFCLMTWAKLVRGARVWHDAKLSDSLHGASEPKMSSIDADMQIPEEIVVDEDHDMKLIDSVSPEPNRGDGQATPVKFKGIPMDEGLLPVVKSGPDLASLSVGAKGEPLLPALVPSSGTTSTLTLLEDVNVKEKDCGALGDTFPHKIGVCDASSFKVVQKGAGQMFRFQTEDQDPFSTVKAFNRDEHELFMLKMPRENWKFGRWTWRVQRSNTSDPLFTITQAFTQEWYIYKGRKRDNALAYFCEADQRMVIHKGIFNWYQCYASPEDKDKVLAKMEYKKIPRAAEDRHRPTFRFGKPDEYTLEVESGQDAGLLAAWSVLVDYTFVKPVKNSEMLTPLVMMNTFDD